MAATDRPSRGFTLTRLLDASPATVFRAWTDPGQLGWFFNPNTVPDGPATVDLRVGGQWRQHMKIDATHQYITGGVYRDIVPGEKLVFSFGAVGGWPDIDLDRLDDGPLVTVALRPVGARTELRLTLHLPDQLSDEKCRELLALGMEDGWGQTVDRLVAAFATPAARAVAS
jgi:uncharacterized protein YndB with AHSA1/START domain